MKTQLIPLETHDDLISIRDKMSWAKTPRMLLVWPKNGRVDVRPLDLTLLRRHAIALGAELGLVTRNAEIRAAAQHIDIPVFSKASQAQRKTWPMRVSTYPGRRAPRLDMRALRADLPGRELFDELSQSALIRLIVFTFGVLAVLLIPLVFLPSAEIRLTAPTRPQSIEIDVSAEPAAEQVALTGVIPSHLQTFELELTDSIPSSGQTVVPNQAAEGMLRFTNLSTQAVDVPAGTVVLTLSDPPVRFSTIDAAQVPAGAGSLGYVRARAMQAGADGNISGGRLTAFEGPLGLSLSVTNPLEMSGGADLPGAAPTQSDLQTLHERLMQSLEAQARQKLVGQFRPGDVAFNSSFSFSKVVREAYSPAIGQPGGKLTLTLRVEFRVYYATEDDLKKLARGVLDASLPAGYEPQDATLRVTAASPFFGGVTGLTRWRIRASRTLRAHIDPARVIWLAQGKTARRAGSALRESFGLAAEPQISIKPFFWPWLPSLPFQIKVIG